MENIIEPNELFDFSKLTLAHPSGIQGGAYFTKIEYNSKPLYIQTSKSLTRQGFVKTGKKYYCDLMFDKNSEVLINWFENLEEKCQKLIYEKKDSWFQNSLEENDIESAFNSIIRVYKSGKYYLVRTNVKNTRTDEPAVKIYNESILPLTISDVSAETNIVSILEIQGIKFTSRNFQIEIEIKQVMVLDNEPIFNNCLIKTSKNKQELQEPKTLDNSVKNPSNTKDDMPNNLDNIINNQIDFNESNNLNNLNNLNNSNNDPIDKLEVLETLDIINHLEENKKETNPDNENISLELDFEDLDETIEENPNELSEVNIDNNLENSLESITLKKPNQVYFELYLEARKKAKLAKKNAILAYLEAKNIKKTYMLENINDSDSDLDAEIDDVSESELEGL
jgi:hypothetical protein